jgi:hypothetical protein
MYRESTRLHLPSQMDGGYDNRMHRMMRQRPQPPPLPPLKSSKSSGRPDPSRGSVHLANESIKPKKNSSITGTSNNAYWWDVAHVTSRHYEQEQSTNKERRLTFRRIVKLCVYIIFFCVVLTSAIVSKLSLFTMINAYKTREQVCYDYLSKMKKIFLFFFFISLMHTLFDGKYFYLLQWVYHIY